MKSFFRKAGVVLLKFLGIVFFIALFAIVATSVSPVYNFSEARPFSGFHSVEESELSYSYTCEGYIQRV